MEAYARAGGQMELGLNGNPLHPSIPIQTKDVVEDVAAGKFDVLHVSQEVLAYSRAALLV